MHFYPIMSHFYIILAHSKENTMIWPANIVQNQLTIDYFYSFFEVHRNFGFHFPGETHDFWECVYVLSGRIVASGDERVYTLNPGEIIFHKPMELHKYYVDSASGADLLIFSFSLEGPLSSTLKNKVFLLSKFQQALISTLLNYIRSNYANVPESESRMPEHQYLSSFQATPTYSQMLTTYLYQLFLTLAGDGVVADVSVSPEAKLFQKAVNYMNDHLSRQLGISDIAAFCNTSEATLKRIFTRFSGMGVHRYFLTLKIQAATDLLRQGNSVTETAEKLGFSSQAYFSATYKRETGLNPSQI